MDEDKNDGESMPVDLLDSEDRENFSIFLSEALDISMDAACIITNYAMEIQENDDVMYYLKEKGLVVESGIDENGHTTYDATEKLLEGDYEI